MYRGETAMREEAQACSCSRCVPRRATPLDRLATALRRAAGGRSWVDGDRCPVAAQRAVDEALGQLGWDAPRPAVRR